MLFGIVWFFDVSLGSVVDGFVGPGKGEGAGATGGLDDFLVGFALEIGVICNVFPH